MCTGSSSLFPRSTIPAIQIPAKSSRFSFANEDSIHCAARKRCSTNVISRYPGIHVANVAEDEAGNPDANPNVKRVEEYAAKEGAQVVAVSAKIEAEIAELPDDEAEVFLEELGLPESGLDKLIKASYSLLGLINFFTAGADEVRAWTIVNGTKAQKAAGKIHTDIERGFIRAEIVSYDDLIACGSEQAAKEKGLVRLEGKDYIMQDGDVTYFRFNV